MQFSHFSFHIHQTLRLKEIRRAMVRYNRFQYIKKKNTRQLINRLLTWFFIVSFAFIFATAYQVNQDIKQHKPVEFPVSLTYLFDKWESN